MSMEILRPGLLSTIQDLGRFGYQESGFAPSGASDSLSMKRANALVGNDPGEAVVEMMLLGITAYFRAPSVIALTGADMSPKINGAGVENGCAIRVEPGDVLELSGTSDGPALRHGGLSGPPAGSGRYDPAPQPRPGSSGS